MGRQYKLTKINESEVSKLSHHELQHLENKLVRILKEYRHGILHFITYDYAGRGVVYKKDPIMDIDQILKSLYKEFSEDIIREMGVDSLFMQISQILQLKRRNTIRNVKQEFERYLSSIHMRIQRILDRDDDSDHRPSEYFDQEEGEHSVIHRRKFTKEKYELDVELAKLQKWVETKKQKVVIIFEGRDSAGKGSTIKKFVENMNPRTFKVVALGVPTEEEKTNWFKRYERHLPKSGEITLFDRSWYNRAVVEPAMGYCTEEQYNGFMENVIDWEEDLIDRGYYLVKFWFSITKAKQLQRFDLRKKSPIKYWKFSPNDAKIIDKWEVITKYKNIMLNKTSSRLSPWVVVNSNDKRIGSLNAIRYALSKIPYQGKNTDILDWFPEVITIVE